MMGLMIEEMAEREPEGIAPQLRIHLADVRELALQIRIRQALDPGFDALIFIDARALQFLEIRVDLIREGCEFVRTPLEATHPDAVGKQDVIERAVNGLEEGPQILLALCVW